MPTFQIALLLCLQAPQRGGMLDPQDWLDRVQELQVLPHGYPPGTLRDYPEVDSPEPNFAPMLLRSKRERLPKTTRRTGSCMISEKTEPELSDFLPLNNRVSVRA